MSDQTTETAPSAMTVVRGGVTHPADFGNGKIDDVFIRLLPIRQMDSYLACYENMASLIELVCDKPPGWCDELTEDSVFDLNRKVREVNDPRFDRWASEQALTVGSKMKDLLAKLRG